MVGLQEDLVQIHFSASDREQMMRDSPDYAPVKLRRGSSNFSFHDDNSIGTDDTDLNAYRDIPSHRVKIYRESVSEHFHCVDLANV